MELAGHECVGFCEWDKFATASYISMHLITEEQKQHLSALDLKKRQKEILKDEYRNGEWYSNDICNVDAGSVPRADCWCFGAPCQDFSVAGKRAGLDGDRSSLVRQVFRILGGLHEEDRPEWLIYENVKGMLSSNKGFDFLAILLEMDELGYDIEWQLFNSKDWGVPQNRERVYTVGHLRSRGERKIFPVTGTDGENSVQLMPQVIGGIGEINFGKQWRQGNRIYDSQAIATALEAQPVGNAGGNTNLYSVPISIMGHRDGYRRNTQVFAPEGITEALDTAAGGGRGHHVGIDVIGLINGEKNTFGADRNRILGDGHAPSLRATDYKDLSKVAIPVLTPDRTEKRQNGRRFKEDGEEMFTLTAQDRHGVGISISANNVTDKFDKPEVKGLIGGTQKNQARNDGKTCPCLTSSMGCDGGYVPMIELATKNNETEQEAENTCNPGIMVQMKDFAVYAVWYEKYQCYIAIRKLTPKECFRLQGWTDDYFEKAQFVNHDSQLYKQAGNGVTVNVVYEIAKRMSV